VGPNGIGKSTLLGLIGGTLEPTRGHIYRNPKVRLAVFSQHHVDGLDLALTPLRYIAKCFPDAKDPQHRSHLASFGVGAELAAQPMYTLSGGQKSRVALAKVRGWVCLWVGRVGVWGCGGWVGGGGNRTHAVRVCVCVCVGCGARCNAGRAAPAEPSVLRTRRCLMVRSVSHEYCTVGHPPTNR
jgi:hypothetical protein